MTNVPELRYQLVAATGAAPAVEFNISIPRLPEERDLVNKLVLGSLPAVSGEFIFRKTPGIRLNGELTISWLAVSKRPQTEPAPEVGLLKQTMAAEIENLRAAIMQERESRKWGKA
jgi:hypothetical protein